MKNKVTKQLTEQRVREIAREEIKKERAKRIRGLKKNVPSFFTR
jgi:hypothetical protein